MRLASRRGSALLIVLGFLALMSASAVAFSARMRGARAPGAVLMRAERGRFLLEAALARAMSGIDAALGDAHAADWPGRVLGADDPAATNGVVPVLTLEALAYLPPPIVPTVRRRAVCASTARWQRLDFDAGRVAYLAVDVSDLPDVNLVPVLTNRSFSACGRLSLAPFFASRAEAQQFAADVAAARAEFPGVPFISLLDLNLATGDAATILSGGAVTHDRTFVVDTLVSSAPAVRHPGLVALTDPAENVHAALEYGLGDDVRRTLDDYLDANHVPLALDLPCAERVPQVGAIGWRATDGGVSPAVAVAFPFRKRAEPDGSFGLIAAFTVASDDGAFTASAESMPVEVSPSEDYEDGDPVHAYSIDLPSTLLPPAEDELGMPEPPMILHITVALRVTDEDGAVVDETPALAFTATCTAGSLGGVGPDGYAVEDARLNWKPEQWRVSETTVEEWRGRESEQGAMVSDTGYLQSVGELALLPRADEGALDLEGLGLVDDRGEGPRVDPFTTSTNVMLMALMETPRDWNAAATNAAVGTRETLESAFGVGRGDLEMIAARLMDAFAGVRASGDWRAAYDALDWLDEGEGASPFRGTCLEERLTVAERMFLRDYWRGCFGKTRQLFLVFLRAEYGPRGVAVVWRDPYPSGSGAPHAMRVHFYHQLEM